MREGSRQLDVIAAERRGATLQDQLAKREPADAWRRSSMWASAKGTSTSRWSTSRAKTFQSWSRAGRFPGARRSIALDVLDVLVKAHNFQTVIEERTHRGIIHGDIKPRNIRITTAGR